jgi:hypothetical protein
MSRSLLGLALAIAVTACSPTRPSGNQAATGPAQPQQLTQAEVVTAERAAQAALPGAPLSIAFGHYASGPQLVASFLAQADVSGAAMVSDLAIYLRMVRDGRVVECRSEIVPEAVTSSGWQPAQAELVLAGMPVTRTVVEYEQRCGTVVRTEPVTTVSPYCHSVSKPGSYTSQSDCYFWAMGRTEQVANRECRNELVTRTVTRFEFQYETRFIPGPLDRLSRQRLRELPPVCYVVAADAMTSNQQGAVGWITGMLHPRR